MRIAEFLRAEGVVASLEAQSKQAVLEELAAALARANPSLQAATILSVLAERERLGSTGVGEGVAIPHGKLPGLTTLCAALAVSKDGIDFDAIDGKKTHLFFALVAPEHSAGLHLKALARISRIFKSSVLRERLIGASSAADMQQIIADEDSKA